MVVKEFLTPDWKKLVLIIILFAAFSLSTYFIFYTEKCQFVEFKVCFSSRHVASPLEYVQIEVERTLVEDVGDLVRYNFIIVNLVIDLVIWYFLSCFMFWVVEKFRKRGLISYSLSRQ